jgi:hypothetical protein
MPLLNHMSRFYKRQETLSAAKPHGFEAVIPKLIAASNVCAGLAAAHG